MDLNDYSDYEAVLNKVFIDKLRNMLLKNVYLLSLFLYYL